MTGRKFPWLALPGILMMLAAWAMLWGEPEICQYAFLPGRDPAGPRLAEAEERWAGSFSATALHGTAEEVSLSAGEQNVGEITLYEVAGGYFELYPRRFVSGRPLSRGDGNAHVIVLDEALAFQLFGDRDPLEREVRLGETRYQVVGVAEHRYRTGERGSFTAWVPLGAEKNPDPALLVASAGGNSTAGLETLFENGARETFGPGQAWFTRKESIRGTILPRTVLIVLAIRLLAACWHRAGRLFRRWTAEIREELKRRYPRQMLGMMGLRGVGMALVTALILGACAGLAIWATEPMTVFPEWVPENLVSPEAIAGRFRELTASAAAPVQFRTPELAEIRLWSGILRWGTVLALLGGILRRMVATKSRK